MERIACRKCQMPYRRRSIVAHEQSCLGEQEGFTPVHGKGRFFYQCQTCGLKLKKQQRQNHRIDCVLDDSLQKFLVEGASTASGSQFRPESLVPSSVGSLERSAASSVAVNDIEPANILQVERQKTNQEKDPFLFVATQ